MTNDEKNWLPLKTQRLSFGSYGPGRSLEAELREKHGMTDDFETCSDCMGTGIANHPDSGSRCFRCEGNGVTSDETERLYLETRKSIERNMLLHGQVTLTLPGPGKSLEAELMEKHGMNERIAAHQTTPEPSEILFSELPENVVLISETDPPDEFFRLTDCAGNPHRIEVDPISEAMQRAGTALRDVFGSIEKLISTLDITAEQATAALLDILKKQKTPRFGKIGDLTFYPHQTTPTGRTPEPPEVQPYQRRVLEQIDAPDAVHADFAELEKRVLAHDPMARMARDFDMMFVGGVAAASSAIAQMSQNGTLSGDELKMPVERQPPDRLCAVPGKQFYNAAAIRGLDVYFNDKKRPGDVHAYCVSDGWVEIRHKNGRQGWVMERGEYRVTRLKGDVRAVYREG